MANGKLIQRVGLGLLLLIARANPNQAGKDGFTAMKAAQVRKNKLELLSKGP
jgi:hypothetical protein